MDFERYVFAEPYFGWLSSGVKITLVVTLLTTVTSLCFGLLVSRMRISPFGLSRAAAAVYINIFRNIPLIPLLLLLVIGLPGVYQALMGSPMPAGIEFPMLIAGLTFNTSAYLAEEIRSGIRGVPGTQWDAGRVFGIGPTRLLVSVIYPQALRIALPAVGNRLVHNMKNSTVALVLPLDVDSMEVLGQAGRVAGQTFAWAEPLIFAALVHLCLALLFGAIVSWLAARAQRKVDLVL